MILLGIIVLLIGAPLSALADKKPGGCVVSLRTDLNYAEQPLVLEKGGPIIKYVSPRDASGTLYFKPDEEIRIVCIGQNNYLTGLAGDTNHKDVVATCVSGTTFRVGSVERELRDLKCFEVNLSVARRTTERCINENSKMKIGFDLGNNEFLTTIELCRDEGQFRTFYAEFRLTKFIGGFQNRVPRPFWQQNAEFWGPYNLNILYNRNVEIDTISYILNSTELGHRYVSNTTEEYYSRGHLVAFGDFLYGTARGSTFWSINSLPQWFSFNGGNWQELEDSVRKYAKTKKVDLDVYTGTHGIMTLPDVHGEEQSLYFYASDDIRALEIPLYFWKIVYDPISQKATAFVGVNNPYINPNLTSAYHICEDISSQTFPLSWHPNDIVRGISYACTYDGLRQNVTTVPHLTVVGLLK